MSGAAGLYARRPFSRGCNCVGLDMPVEHRVRVCQNFPGEKSPHRPPGVGEGLTDKTFYPQRTSPMRSRIVQRETISTATAAKPAASPIQIPIPSSSIGKPSHTANPMPTTQ